MNKFAKIAIVIVLIVVVGAVIALKENNKADSKSKDPGSSVENIPAAEPDKAEQIKALPRLVDLGAGKCIPCIMMAPILEELKKEYAGRFRVDFFDVWKDPDIAREYRIRIIPTQIFFDASGKELFRHEGFFAREDILSKWKELGVDIEKKQK